MRIAAIICEYNPLHSGHIHHIARTRELTGCDYLVCIMSGNFTQRGEIACLDKYTRARHAVLSGADCVIELPTIYATSGADYFARGGVEIASKINDITHLSFGSECGDIGRLTDMARLSSNDTFNAAVQSNLARGLSYPIATEQAYKSCGYEHGISPNNTLAIAYLRALDGSDITPVTIVREGSGYHDTSLSCGFPSATALRSAICNGDDITEHVPSYVYNDLKSVNNMAVACKSNNFNSINKLDIQTRERFFAIVASSLLNSNAPIYEDGEGLINRAIAALTSSNSYDELAQNIHTKRYTKSRINRFLMHAALHHCPALLAAPIDYMRVLAIKNSCRDEIMSRLLPMQSESALFHNDCYTDRIYSIITGHKRDDRRLQIIDN